MRSIDCTIGGSDLVRQLGSLAVRTRPWPEDPCVRPAGGLMIRGFEALGGATMKGWGCRRGR